VRLLRRRVSDRVFRALLADEAVSQPTVTYADLPVSAAA
jgi:hypothetical protein